MYLEHGAHWAIGALAVIMLLSIEPRFQVPEAVDRLGRGGLHRGGVDLERAAQSAQCQG